MNDRLRQHSSLTWLIPGMHIKRWLFLLMFGVALMGLGIAYILREAYISYTFPGVFYYLTLQFIPRIGRGVLFMMLALSAVGIATWQLNRSLLYAFVRPRHDDEPVSQAIFRKRILARGPRIVAIGGGTGLSRLLHGLRDHTSNITAIVTVADDGGSSGRLRREFGVVAPGDLRQCIVALAESEPLMSRLFQYRFSEGSGLEGHSFGNLFIVAMAEVTGNFETALEETSRVLNVRGTILPSTLEDVTLSARTATDEIVIGEHLITERGQTIRELFLNPANPEAHPDAVRAILEADMVLLGPGSLYTSVLPNLLVPGIRKALEMSTGTKVFICNVATEHGETDGYSVADHIETIDRHVGTALVDAVIANSNFGSTVPGANYTSPVELRSPRDERLGDTVVVAADVVSAENPYRHDPEKLAGVIMQLYTKRGSRGPSARSDRSREAVLATR